MFGDRADQEENSRPSPGGGGRIAGHLIAIAVAAIIIVVIAGGVLLNDAMKGPAVTTTRNTTALIDDSVFQVSTIDALMASLYDGAMTTRDLKSHGNFGSGTFEGLDGELIALDGSFYQARSDGTVSIADPSEEVPFAMVKFFRPDNSFTISSSGNMTEFEYLLDHLLPSGNYIYAIRADGTFPELTVRAIPKQEKPYPVLSAAAEHQSVLHLTNTTGTIVGFYFPPSFSNINVPGYHFHYLSSDRSRGGHVLDLTTPDSPITVTIDQASDFDLQLPVSETFRNANLSKALSGEVNSVERGTR